jgi:hypothetical protein
MEPLVLAGMSTMKQAFSERTISVRRRREGGALTTRLCTFALWPMSERDAEMMTRDSAYGH